VSALPTKTFCEAVDVATKTANGRAHDQQSVLEWKNIKLYSQTKIISM
jgi:hypothetical protein